MAFRFCKNRYPQITKALTSHEVGGKLPREYATIKDEYCDLYQQLTDDCEYDEIVAAALYCTDNDDEIPVIVEPEGQRDVDLKTRIFAVDIASFTRLCKIPDAHPTALSWGTSHIAREAILMSIIKQLVEVHRFGHKVDYVYNLSMMIRVFDILRRQGEIEMSNYHYRILTTIIEQYEVFVNTEE